MTWLSSTPASTPQPEPGPEGFGEAVEAAVLMLGMMTALTWVGFQWQRNGERAAHRFAVDLVEQVARHGDAALIPGWSGLGRGPSSVAARHTFQALRSFGHLVEVKPGRCDVASRFALCRGTRYSCRVSGATSAGPVEAAIGLCRTGSSATYTFDSFDLQLPAAGNDRGDRGDAGRDGLIRYGTTPLPPDRPPVRLRRGALQP